MIFGFLDASTAWQIGIQDPATPVIAGIIHFHNHLMFFLVLIASLVVWLLYRTIYFFEASVHPESSRFTHSTPLEVVWTITPALILLIIALPSFTLLYSIEEIIAPSLTLKVVGHQWYWSYEYSDYEEGTINFDSYIIAEEDLPKGGLRLLEVDNRVVLPAQTHVRILVTAADVLHSWAVPSLGVKVDACPGRLNQVSIFLNREGTFYGQCSEICGVNHGFIPIVVESVSIDTYLSWLTNKI
jgi:cytochrome c oxidase subunit 2